VLGRVTVLLGLLDVLLDVEHELRDEHDLVGMQLVHAQLLIAIRGQQLTPHAVRYKPPSIDLLVRFHAID